MSTAVAKLCWGKFWFEYQGQGCSETLDFLEPVAAGALTPIETLAMIHNELALYRATTLPKGVTMKDAAVGYYGKPPDGTDSLWGIVRGLASGATYKFGTPNDMNGCAGFGFTSVAGRRSSWWMRFIDDADAVDNAFAQQPVGFIIKPVAMPVSPVYGDTKSNIIKTVIEALMFRSVQGRKNPLFIDPITTPAILPYTYDDWRRATFTGMVSRKLGRVRGAQAGRRGAYT